MNAAERYRAHVKSSARCARAGRQSKALARFGNAIESMTNETIRMALSENRDSICDGTLAIGAWDVSMVDNMEGLFEGWSEFNQPIGKWDTTSVTTMASMFKGCASFNQPIREWETRRVQSMASTFEGCSSLNQYLSWDTGSVIDMSRMFRGCTSFARTLAFDMGTVLDAQYMFHGCSGAKLIALQPNSDIVEMLEADLGYKRLSIPSRDPPVYTLGPNRDRCYDHPRAHIGVYATPESRSLVLPELHAAVVSGRITGSRPIPAAYAWPLILGANRGGRSFGVSSGYLMKHVNPESDTADVLVVVRHEKRSAVTAFVRVNVSDQPKRFTIYGTPVHESWRRGMAYVPIVISSIDAPSGHAAESLAATLQLAKTSNKHMLVLGALDSAMLWYLNTCFLADTHQVVLNTRESFEKTRVYALSDRDGVDLESTLKDALDFNGEVLVAFVFGTGGVSGREILSGMDYAGLRYERPGDLGTYVRMFRVAECPLIKGASYEFMEYTEACSASAARSGGARGYMYENEAEGGKVYGLVQLAGEFVRVRKDYAVFEVDGEKRRIPTGTTGFRRTFSSYIVDVDVEPR
jgi:surface protein